MLQIPSIDWPRRTLPLIGTEDLLKQNPSSDPSPQEERIPTSLIADYTIDQLTMSSVGTGTSIVYGRFTNDLQFRSIAAASSRVSVSLLSNTVEIDANAVQIANSISLSDIGDVINSPTTGYFLQYNGSSWITAPVLDEFYISDGTTTEVVDGVNQTITFTGTPNIYISVGASNTVSFNWIANLTDLSDIPIPNVADTVLTWDGSTFSWSSFGTVSSGTVTDGQNVGSMGVGVFSSKLGSLLRFRNVAANSSKISVSLNANDIKIDASPLAIANEIKVVDLLDVSGTPVHGDMLLFNDTTNQWETSPASSAGVTFTINDQNYLFNTFNSVTDLRVYGTNGILTQWNTTTDLKIYLDASLTNLNDISFSSLADGDVLIYNSGSSVWENKPFQINLLGNSGGQILKNNDSLKLLGQNGINVQIINPDTALIMLNASITQLNDIGSPSSADQFLYWDGTNFIWEDIGTLGGGQSNTASNVGNSGIGVFKQKTGVNLEFRNVAPASAKIDVSLDVNNNILVDAVPTEIADEIALEDLNNVTNTPTTDGFLKYNGSSWVTDNISLNFSFNVEADSGSNMTIEDGETYIVSGDNQFISTYNYLSGSTQETQISLDIAAVANAIDLEDLQNVFGNPTTNDTIIYDGSKFIFQPPATQTFSNAWLLGGNNEAGEEIFGTLNNFDIPIYTNNAQVGIFKTNGRFGWGVSSPSSTIEVSGSNGIGNVVSKNADYTATISDYMIIVDASGGNVTITLPSASGVYRREYVIKKVDSSANTVTVASASLVDGASTFTMYSQYYSVKVKSDASTWHIF
jgi:hypothetical protein